MKREKVEQHHPTYLPPYWWTPPEEEIDLLEYWRVLLRGRWKVLGAMVVAGVLAAVFSLLMPNVYRADVLLLSSSSSSSSVTPEIIRLAILAGLGKSEASERYLAELAKKMEELVGMEAKRLAQRGLSSKDLDELVHSAGFLSALLAKGQLSQICGSEEEDCKERIRRAVRVKSDRRTSLAKLQVEWTDPAKAATLANLLASALDDYLRKREIAHIEDEIRALQRAVSQSSGKDRRYYASLLESKSKLLLALKATPHYAFRIIARAVPPEKKVKPKRALITVLAMLVAGFLAVIYVFAAEGIRRRREEEAAQRA